MKLKFILVCLLALIFVSNVLAETNDSLALDSELQSAQASNSMTWPMLPGESLNGVAHMFYPKNVVMQRLFISKTLLLNTGTQPNLSAAQRFEKPTLLLVPTLKSLSKNTQITQSTAEKPAKHRLQITADIESVLDSVPSKLKEEYQFWVSKNELLKQQLVILKDKIVFLETKLDGLKLIWEKTLNSPVASLPAINNPSNNSIENNLGTENKAVADSVTSIVSNSVPANVPSITPSNSTANNNPVIDNATTGKKIFKNLNTTPTKVETAQIASSWINYLNTDLVKVALVLGLLVILSVFALKKYREYMFAKMNFVATKMHASIQETMVDFGGYLKPKIPEEESPEVKLQAKAAKDVEARLDSTLAEAKLLMSVNRHQDAIAHLKLTIEAQPKACINHWLYLLEIYRKLNLKDEFEAHAAGLHQIYNVMTPVWYETAVAMVVPQSLEEFPHIMEKLYTVWPGDLATVYLRGLIADNRGGERVGFGKAALSEILMLIEILDIQKELA